MDLLRSKKFIVAVAGVVTVVITHFVPDIDPEQLNGIVVIVFGYLLGQGLADFGKEAK